MNKHLGLDELKQLQALVEDAIQQVVLRGRGSRKSREIRLNQLGRLLTQVEKALDASIIEELNKKEGE